jgi:hypothetical protein
MTDEDLLYTLAVRLIPRRGRFEEQSTEPLLLAGRLPPLPLQRPLPEGAQIIGSVVEGDVVTILLDTDQSPGDAVAFYGTELAAAGWKMLSTAHPRGGFEHARHGHAIFCRTDLGPKLTVNAHQYPGRLTQVRLQIDLATDQPCTDPAERPRPPQIGPVPSLPELAPPAGAMLRTMGGEAGPMGTSAHAELITRLDLAGVADHYAEEMRLAGCVERDRGQGDLVAWSTWEVDHPEHGPSQGLFLALQQVNDPTRYFLYERVAWAPST